MGDMLDFLPSRVVSLVGSCNFHYNILYVSLYNFIISADSETNKSTKYYGSNDQFTLRTFGSISFNG
jgi:hypothetical protein